MSELPTMLGQATEAANTFTSTQVDSDDTITPKIVFVTFKLPVQSECVTKSFQDEATRVDLGKLSRSRIAKVQALRRGMTSTGCRLMDGSVLRTNSDVLYYILDQIDIPS
jgi:hypothetical protein